MNRRPEDPGELLNRIGGPQALYGARLADAQGFVERALRLRSAIADVTDAEWQELAERAATDLREDIDEEGTELRRRLLYFAAELLRHGLRIAHEARTLYDEAELRELGEGP